MLLATDLARLFVGVVLLAFASFTDWWWRRAPNLLWLVMAGAGALALVVDAVARFDAVRDAWPYLAFAPVFAGLMWVMYRFHLIAGGADAKALMALALLVPFPLALAPGVPVIESPMPGAFSVLGNALVAFLLIPVTLFLVNAVTGGFSPLMFLGYRKRVADLQAGHDWPMEVVEDDGTIERVWFPSRFEWDMDALRDAMREKGRERVWVTPKIPFMIPLLVGFVSAFLLGDVLYGAIDAVLGG